MQIHLHPYSPTWPSSFLAIKAELDHDLSVHRLPYTSIQHIGSTAVPSLLAKPIIDILITIPPQHFQKHVVLCQYRGALMHGERQGGYRYIGDGGVKGRWSFKLGAPAVNTYPYHHHHHIEEEEQQQQQKQEERRPPPPHPRNVYITPHGGLVHRSCSSLVDTLVRSENADLRAEYAAVKLGASVGPDGRPVEYDDVMQYSRRKDEVVRKILRRAGWKEGEIEEKEEGVVKGWPTRGRMIGEGEGGWWGAI